ncbi:RES family NAD+ phosphorylase [Burkholderia cenocepacia]|nr:RES family NAD+ phosphorylase [Burkholderia cenocepacia]
MLANPERELGSPPAQAARAGRMNAAGISVFYGAVDMGTCIGEVRAPVGAHGMVAAFDIARELVLLDVAALAGAEARNISHFDPEYILKNERVGFLQQLSRVLQVPVLPGEGHRGYLPSQMVAEFLGSRNRPRFDGVLFPSIQSGGQGTNVVLFHHASVVQRPAVDRRLELYWPDWDRETSQTVEGRDVAESARDEPSDVFDDERPFNRPDDRVPALQLCIDRSPLSTSKQSNTGSFRKL